MVNNYDKIGYIRKDTRRVSPHCRVRKKERGIVVSKNIMLIVTR
jgi:hypothetical protein